MRIASTLLAVALMGAMAGAWAANATVEAVQYPAWLDRGGNTVPLTPGTILQGDDKLRTGGNARVQVRMDEGSTVKLGENAQFVIERVENRGVFRAALSVLTGAFRFTTLALRKSQQRDITIKVKNVTAGIRGTDLWGKSTGERDIVCLLEGKISVGSEGNPTVTLDQPLDFYQKPRDGSPVVAKVDAKQVEIWSAETEISKEGPAGREGGKWRVIAAEFPARDPALAMNRQLRASGYPSEIGKHGDMTTVVVAGIAGEAEARALMANLRTVPGIKAPTVQGP
jgi:FecR protein/SPOR domain